MKKATVISLLVLFCATAYSQKQWTLKDCINHAIEHNVEVRKQEITQKQSEIDLHTARYSRLPNLNGSASQSFGRGLNNDNSYVDNAQSTGFNLGAEIPLFTGFQIPNSIALNKLNLQAAIEDLNKVKEDIGIQVTYAFLQVLFNRELHQVAVNQVDLSNQQYERIKRLHEIGKAAISDVYEANARLAEDQVAAVQAENTMQLSLLDLSQLLELPSPEGFTIAEPANLPDLPTLNNPEDIYSQAINNRPAIQAATYRVEGAKKSILIAKSAYYPRLSFSAGLSSSYNRISHNENLSFVKQMKDHFNKQLSFSLSIPIFNRFETRDKVKGAQLQQFSQILALEDTKKALYKEIQQAYYSALAAQAKYTAGTTAMQANEAAFKLINEKYINGKATALEFSEAKTNLMKTQSENIQAKYDYLFRMKIIDFYKGEALDF